MPLTALKLLPGVNVEKTPTLNQAGISESNFIRFWDNMPQKLGGWERYYPFELTSLVRELHAWQDLNAVKHLALGAETFLSVITDGDNEDITPRTRTANITPDFSTTMGDEEVVVVDTGSQVTVYDYVFIATPVSVGGIILSGLYPVSVSLSADSYQIVAADPAGATEVNGGVVPEFDTTDASSEVVVTLPDHGLVAGDFFDFFVSTTVGGVTISGTYQVLSVASADEFTINASSVATSTANAFMNSGDVRLIYYIAVGPVVSGSGYGVGGYGEGGYGTGATLPANPGDPITATFWSMDNWGEVLLACPTGGAIYFWAPSGGFATASLVGNAPIVNGGIFIAMPQRILVAWGSCDIASPGVRDPLMVRWSAAGNYDDWVPTIANQSGQFRIPTGSRIVGGLQGPQQAVLWTDIDMWFMNYVGSTFTFGFTKVSSGCGLVGMNAAGVLGTKIYWMNLGGFYYLSGGAVKPIECSVWDAVFQDLDKDNLDKVVCAPNSMFNEITWYYPSTSSGTGEPDRYVKFSEGQGGDQQVWDLGVLERTAWIDQSVLGEPIGASGEEALIFQHEVSPNADGAAMSPYFVTGEFLLDEGNNCVFIDWLLPDFKYGNYNGDQSAEVLMTIYTREFPNSPQTALGPYTFSEAVNELTTRARGRQASLRFESGDQDSFWRLGNMRFRTAQDGRR